MLTGDDMDDAEWLEAVAYYEGDTRLDLLDGGPERVERLRARVAELTRELEAQTELTVDMSMRSDDAIASLERTIATREPIDEREYERGRADEREAVVSRVRNAIAGWPESVSSVYKHYGVIAKCRDVVESALGDESE